MKEVLNVSDYLARDFVIDLAGNSKEEVLQELLDVITTSEVITDKQKFCKAIYTREKLMSTGIGYEVAVPHARDKSVNDFVIAVGRKVEGINYPSIDDKPVKLIFMIGASDRQDKDYIKLLSRIVLRIKNPAFMSRVMEAKDSAEVFDIIRETS